MCCSGLGYIVGSYVAEAVDAAGGVAGDGEGEGWRWAFRVSVREFMQWVTDWHITLLPHKNQEV